MEDCLPKNFAEKLIELESMLDEQYSMELIQELNDLYRVPFLLIADGYRLLHSIITPQSQTFPKEND
jgi:hypothetical protein